MFKIVYINLFEQYDTQLADNGYLKNMIQTFHHNWMENKCT